MVKKTDQEGIDLQFKYDNIEDAIQKATELSKTNECIQVIRSIDGYRTPDAKVMYYVENSVGGFLRTFEKAEHFWNKGKQKF